MAAARKKCSKKISDIAKKSKSKTSNGTSAWRRGQTARIEKAYQMKDNFVCPDMVVLHWDGKTLKLRGNIKSNRVCVYLSGVSEESYRKLHGIPECCSGKGADEADLVQDMLEYNPFFRPTAKECVRSPVFDEIRVDALERDAGKKIEILSETQNSEQRPPNE